MRLVYNFFGILLLLGSVGWGQETNGAVNAARARRQRMMQQRQQQQQQNPAAFAPDPAPIQPQPAPALNAVRPQPTPQALASPTPPEQLPPASPPQVTYSDGLPTVVAANSNLSSVLSAIRNKAGVQFEGLEGGSPERVAITMGPAPEADVLAAILGGSNFDYIILERPDSPGIVQKVMLTPRGASANAGQLARNPDADADDEEEAAEEPVAPQDTPIRPPIAQLPQQPNPDAQPPQRTPEQMVEEMKRRAAAQQPQPAQNAPIKQSPPQF